MAGNVMVSKDYVLCSAWWKEFRMEEVYHKIEETELFPIDSKVSRR